MAFTVGFVNFLDTLTTMNPSIRHPSGSWLTNEVLKWFGTSPEKEMQSS